MKKLFLLIGAVMTLGVAGACGNGANASPSVPVTTLGPTLAPIETPMASESPMMSESPMASESPMMSEEPSGSPAESATP